MKKINKYIFNLTISIFSVVLLTVPIFYNSNSNYASSINYLNKASDGLHISSLDDLVSGASTLSASNYTIILDDDIDLSGLTQSDLNTLKSVNQIKELDGNGYSFYNKPKDLYFDPLFGETISLAVNPTYSIYVHNLTLNNAPVLFNSIVTNANSNLITSNNEEPGQSLDTDRSIFDSNITPYNSIYFQNISIINTNFQNQTLNITNEGTLGLLTNSILLYENGSENSDTALTISGLRIANTNISNNTFTPLNNNISFGLISNIYYKVCSTPNHHHIGYVSLNNVIIEDNIMENNTINVEQNAYFSFSPIFASFNFAAADWTGSGGNFLLINNILIQNNLFEKPNGILDDNFSYSDVISQTNNYYANNLYTDTEELNLLISLNNQIYLDKESDILYENPTIIKIANVNGSNTWSQQSTSTLAFIGPNYSKNNNLNLFADESGSDEYNSIYHDSTLNKDENSLAYDSLLINLQIVLGIYGVAFELDQNNNLSKINYASTIDYINIISSDITRDSKGNITNIGVNFDLLLSKQNNVNDELKPYDVLTISDLKLLNNNVQIGIGTEDSYSVVDPLQLNYSYYVDITFDNPIKNFDADDYQDLTLSFTYSDATQMSKKSSTTTVDIDTDELLASMFNPGTNTGDGLAISAAVLGGIVGLILLIFLILLILFLMYRRKVAKVTEVQDGYYEFDDNNSYETYDNYDQAYETYDDYEQSKDDIYEETYDDYEQSKDDIYEETYDDYEQSKDYYY